MASVPTQASARDAGLVRRVGAIGLSGAFIGMLLGSGIYNVPAPMAAAVGSYAPIAFLGCALAVGAVLLCFAEAASRVPTAGGVSGFVVAAFGPYWGFLTGVFIWVSVVLAAGGIMAAATDIIGTVVPVLVKGPIRDLFILGWFLGLAALNMRGVGIGARFNVIATAIKIIPLAVFVAAGIWFIDPVKLTLPPPSDATGIGRAAILGIFMFTGIEGSLAVSGEVANPARTIPRAIIGSLFGYALLCILVQVISQGLLGNALGGSVAPLAEAMAQISSPLGLLLGAGAAISMLGWTASDALSSPRQLFALSRDGFLPASLGRLHPRTHAPYIASAAHAAIAAGLAITGSFASLAALSTLFAVLVYLLGCAAAVKLRRQNIAIAGPPVHIPALSAFAVIGCAAMLWIAAQSTRPEAIGISIFIAAASLLYRLRRRI